MTWPYRTPALAMCSVALLSLGCQEGLRTENGQTGSPYDNPPEYQNSSRYVPALPGGDGDNAPPLDEYEPELTGFSEGNLVVYSGEKLRVLDVSGDVPVEIGSTPLSGFVRQVEVEDGWAWVAIEEETYFDDGVLPEEPLHEQTSRLIAFDLSNPLAPRRDAEIDFDGEIWSFQRRGTEFFAIGRVPGPLGPTCLQAYSREGTVAMRMVHVTLAGGAFEAKEVVEVETILRDGFYSEDSFFVGSDQDPPAGEYELTAIDFTGGTLTKGMPTPLSSGAHSVARREDTVVVSLNDGTLDTLSLAGSELSHEGSVSPELDPGQVWALSDELFVALNRDFGGAMLLNVVDPASPFIASEMDPEVHDVIETEHGLVGIGMDESRSLVVTLWDLTDPAAPLLVDSVMPGIEYWPLGQNNSTYFTPGALRSWTYDPATGRLAVSSQPRPESEVALISVAAGTLSLDAVKYAPWGVSRPILESSSIYGFRGSEVISGSLTEADDWATWDDPRFRATDARVTLGGEEYSLHWEPGTLDHWIRVESTGEQLQLTHDAQTLVVQGDRLLAVGLSGVTILDVDGGLSVAKTLEFPSTVGDASPQEKSQDWRGFFSLPDGRLLFAAEATIHCYSEAECEDLGISADEYASFGPAEIFSTLRLYTLEGAGGSEPKMEFHVETVGHFEFNPWGTRLDLSDQVFLQGDEFGFSREEGVYDSEGEEIEEDGEPLVAHYLTTFSLEDDGSVLLGVDYNVPGRPLLWRGEDLLTATPERISEERIVTAVHRSKLINGGAFIEEDHELYGTFHDARHGEDVAYLLLGPEDACDRSQMRLQPLSLSPEIVMHDALNLSGHWYYESLALPVDQGELTLHGGPVGGAHGVFSLEDPTSPELVWYTTE